MRSLTQEEQAFLAWAFVEWTNGKRTVAEKCDATAESLIAEWEELTACELGKDFVTFVNGIHGVQ